VSRTAPKYQPKHKKASCPRRWKPSPTTMTAAGSTVLMAAVASGVVTVWPATATAQLGAPSTGAWPGGFSGGSALYRAGALDAQLDAVNAYDVQQQNILGGNRTALAAEQASAAAARRQAERAARRARERAAALAARRAAEREAAAVAAERAARRAAAQQAEQQRQAEQQQAQQQQAQQQQADQQQQQPEPSGSPQQIAMSMLGSYGWSSSQFSCLNSLWNEESGWNVYATNPTSGAYGIPQALPASKMASAGPDWQTSAATQIKWGLSYIQETYGSPCAAWAHEEADGWY
jgi:pyruvate/2-oxoglutarate dehydrogenase complex dihydrolipoamide acyltransferase (E2) component